MDTIEKHVGQRLREKRKRLGYALETLAQQLDVSFQQLQKYEKGLTKIPASTLYKLSQALRVPVAYFFEGVCVEGNENSVHHAPDVISLQPRKKLTILIVEDDPDDDYLIRKALEDCPMDLDLHTVHDGEQALGLLKQQKSTILFSRPDLIFLDLNIPKFDGHMLLKAIKKNPQIADIPVVILTNSISHPEMMQTYKNHASGYLCKSFDFATFKANLLSVIQYWGQTVCLPESA